MENIKMAASFSVDKVAPKHNFRTGQIPANVDRERIKDNVVIIDNLHGRTIEQYTNDELQPFIDEYNSKQKRKDRKIDSTYTEWHKADKNMMKGVEKPEDIKWAWEAVLCYGNHEDYWHEYFDPNTTEERRKEMYDEAVEFYTQATYAFKIKYPHLEILYSVLHADEIFGSIHCHLCFQGRGREYERSLVERVSISRALEMDGFEHIHSATMAKEQGGFQMERMFKDFRHNVMNPQLMELGYEIKEEEHGKKHISANAYTELMKKASAEMEKAKTMVDFAKSVEKIQEEELKIVHKKDNGVIFTTYKDSMLSKPREVAIVPREVYDSQESNANIKDIKYATQQAAERTERLCEQTLKSLGEEKNKALEARVEALQQEVYKEREKNIELQKTINKLSSKLSLAIDFIKERGIFQLWERFRKLFEKEQELERKDREQ